MDMKNSMQDIFDIGASAVMGAVSGVAIEMRPFMTGFVRLCSDGWLQGWHERNGGNASYRMTEEEVSSCKSFFSDEGAWVPIGVQAENLRNACFVTTAAGSSMRNISGDITRNVGILEINGAGDSYRIVWGLKGGGKPTSEFPSHFLIHSVRVDATDGASRVLYHAHPVDVIALTKILPLDARAFSRVLWKAMTECIMVFPKGVGVVPCMVPGSIDIAQTTSELMKTYDATIWAQHGLFCSGPDFDMTFGLMHTIEKAARIHCQALMMNGGSSDFPNTITDDDLRAIAKSLDLSVNEDFLE